VNNSVEPVAIKIIGLNGAPRLVREARNELAVMLKLSETLGNCVIELKGFQEDPGVALRIVMELARCSLLRYMSRFPGGCLPLHEWVRHMPLQLWAHGMYSCYIARSGCLLKLALCSGWACHGCYCRRSKV
jgi:hypothetical protein